MIRLEAAIRAIDPAEVLEKVGEVETTAGPWALDTSTGSEILVKGGCSVIEGEDARYLLRLIAADTSTPAPDAVARLVEAARALGAMPEGYCFCSANRVGDDSKIHEPECADLRADLRAALVAKENEQCQVSIGPAIGATINGLHGSGAGAPDAVDNSYPDMVARLVEAAIAEYLLEHPFQTELERMGRKATARGMMVRLGIYEKFKEALAAMEKPQ